MGSLIGRIRQVVAHLWLSHSIVHVRVFVLCGWVCGCGCTVCVFVLCICVCMCVLVLCMYACLCARACAHMCSACTYVGLNPSSSDLDPYTYIPHTLIPIPILYTPHLGPTLKVRLATFSQHHVDGLDMAMTPVQIMLR